MNKLGLMKQSEEPQSSKAKKGHSGTRVEVNVTIRESLEKVEEMAFSLSTRSRPPQSSARVDPRLLIIFSTPKWRLKRSRSSCQSWPWLSEPWRSLAWMKMTTLGTLCVRNTLILKGDYWSQ